MVCHSVPVVRLILLVIPFSIAASVNAESPGSATTEWSQWRGPSRDGSIAQTDWPERLQGRLKLVWEKPLGPSYSGPVVSGELVYTTETVNSAVERVAAHRLSDGEKEWEVEWPGAMTVPFFAAKNGSWIRSTPTCTSEELLVVGMRDVMVSLNPKTGAENWRQDFVASQGSPLPSFGAVCSPIVDGDFIYMQTGGAVVKLNRGDGSVVWSTLEDASGMMSSGAFSSPVIAELAGTRQLVVATRSAVCGVDLETGKVLWQQPIESFRGMNILTPTILGDRIFMSAHSGRAQMFEVSHAGEWKIQELWSQKSQAYMSSPVVVDDVIYMHLKNRRVCAISADGQLLWTSQPFGEYWSMVTNGKQILALDENGELLLIEPNTQELSIVDRIQVANDSWAHLAIQGNNVIVRDLNALKLYSWK